MVGGTPTPLKNTKISWDDEIPYIWKNRNVPNHQSDYLDASKLGNITMRPPGWLWGTQASLKLQWHIQGSQGNWFNLLQSVTTQAIKVFCNRRYAL